MKRHGVLMPTAVKGYDGVMATSAEKIQGADLPALNVIRYPDPRLREDCTPIETIDESVRALAERMLEIMVDSRGVGLAAPQVGVTVRLLLAMPDPDGDDLLALINPRIIREDGWDEQEEGCLSFPDIYCKVKRRKLIVVEALDINGNPIRLELEDFAARVVLHEMDHLDGRLLVDRMSQIAKIANRKSLKRLEAAFEGA
jgi:peptide deformylase